MALGQSLNAAFKKDGRFMDIFMSDTEQSGL